MGSPGDQHDLVDAGVDQGFDRPGDHGPIPDREQVLVGYFCERKKAAAGASR